MSNAASEAVIQEYCRELKLAAVVRDYPGLCRRARDAGWPYEDLLRELLEAEVTNRHQGTARRLLREARFPDLKTFDQLDWTALKGVSRLKLMELASGDFIGRRGRDFGGSDRHWKIARCELQQRYQKVALLIVDELGFVPFEVQSAGSALRTPLDHYHYQPGVLRVGKGIRRRKAHDGTARSPQPSRSHTHNSR